MRITVLKVFWTIFLLMKGLKFIQMASPTTAIGGGLFVMYLLIGTWKSPKKRARVREKYDQQNTNETLNPRMKRWLEEVEEGKRANRANQANRSSYPQRNLSFGVKKTYQKTAAQIAGDKGEENVAYVLRYLDSKKFTVFNDVRLWDAEETAQLDHVVVGPTGVFHIETKNWSGIFRITEDGEWLRVTNGAEVGEVSPVFQVNRHQKILESVVGQNMPITGLIAFVNYNSVVRTKENSPVKVLKAEMLQQHIENAYPVRLTEIQVRQVVSDIKLRKVY